MSLLRSLALVCFLSLPLLPCSVSASGTLKDLEKASDRAFDEHRFSQAVQYLDEALNVPALDADLRAHLQSKRRRAQREVDREWLMEFRACRDAGPTRRVVLQRSPAVFVTTTVRTAGGGVATRKTRLPGKTTSQQTVTSQVTSEKTAIERRSGPAYLMRGEVTFASAGHSRALHVDVHPRWPEGLPPRDQQLRDAAVELASFLQERFRETYTERADAALQRAVAGTSGAARWERTPQDSGGR